MQIVADSFKGQIRRYFMIPDRNRDRFCNICSFGCENGLWAIESINSRLTSTLFVYGYYVVAIRFTVTRFELSLVVGLWS